MINFVLFFIRIIPYTPSNYFLVEPLGRNEMINKSNSDEKLPAILLVEDEPISRDVIKLFLKNICDLNVAVNGEEALELTLRKKYDLILMDINLGRGINGLDAAAKIRALDDYKKTPIVAVTAYAMQGDREKFIAGGCTHYLSKPFTKEGLINYVKDIFLQMDTKK
jgi:CheY-like chemotaxis protein